MRSQQSCGQVCESRETPSAVPFTSPPPEQARDAEDRYFDDSDDSAPSAPTVAREANARMDEDLDY